MSRLTQRLVIRGVNGCSGPPSALLPSAWPSWRSRWRSLLLRLADGDEVLLWWGLDDLHLRHCATSVPAELDGECRQFFDEVVESDLLLKVVQGLTGHQECKRAVWLRRHDDGDGIPPGPRRPWMRAAWRHCFAPRATGLVVFPTGAQWRHVRRRAAPTATELDQRSTKPQIASCTPDRVGCGIAAQRFGLRAAVTEVRRTVGSESFHCSCQEVAPKSRSISAVCLAIQWLRVRDDFRTWFVQTAASWVDGDRRVESRASSSPVRYPTWSSAISPSRPRKTDQAG